MTAGWSSRRRPHSLSASWPPRATPRRPASTNCTDSSARAGHRTPKRACWLVLGQAALRLRELDDAEKHLSQAVALRRRHDDAASLWLAEAQIALAECFALQGRRDESRALLGEAQAIHAQHERVAPHLAAALEKALRAAEAAI